MKYLGTREVFESGIGWHRRWTRGEKRGMKVTMHVDQEGRRQIVTEGFHGAAHRGGPAPEDWWLDLLRATGVEVEVIHHGPRVTE